MDQLRRIVGFGDSVVDNLTQMLRRQSPYSIPDLYLDVRFRKIVSRTESPTLKRHKTQRRDGRTKRTP